jgi:hypothetical protein
MGEIGWERREKGKDREWWRVVWIKGSRNIKGEVVRVA